MGVRRGGQEGGGPLPPWPAKIVSFLTFLGENSMFLGAFRQIVCFCTHTPRPPGKFCPPLEKSLRTPMGTRMI